MGGSSWSDDFYTDRTADRAAKGVPTFAYDADVKAGKTAVKAHDTLNIHNKIRESRDSDAHPDSVAIAVVFDVTGSMHTVPARMQKKLPQLMSLLLRKGYVKDPQVLFGAVGDAFSDKVSLQVGQFESGVEMDDNITNIYLESGGGGTYEESYQNAIYFFGNRTSIDCFEKRGHKGYLFVIGDEMPYKFATKGELSRLVVDGAEADVSVEDCIKAAQEKYNVFFIIPKGTSHYDDPKLRARWSELLGAQNVIMLEDPEAVCETIGLAIGLCEGTATADGMHADLKDVGAGTAVVKAVTRGLDDLAKKTALAKVGTGTLPEKKGRSASTERI